MLILKFMEINMDIDKLYSQIIRELKLNHRPTVSLSEDETRELYSIIQKRDHSPTKELCILAHLKERYPLLRYELYNFLNHNLEGDLFIFGLDIFKKQIIKHSLVTGVPLVTNDLSTILKWLQNQIQNRNFKELTQILLLIEDLGSQCFFFKDILIKLEIGITLLNRDKSEANNVLKRLKARWP